MKRSRNKVILLTAAGVAALALPALAQEVPESLLPPGFGEPQQPPPPPVQPPPQPPAQPRPAPTPGPTRPSDAQPAVTNSAAEDLAELGPLLEPFEPVEIPEERRRSTALVGTHGPENWGVSQDAFGDADGRYVSTLMRRLDAPLPSRWASILLRRALLSRVPAPPHVGDVDWIAERAWLLLRMGEADGARALVQGVDVEDFTPKMFEVGVQTALANSDPAGLCPLVAPGRKLSDEPVWPLADAMCAALEGEASRASALIDGARRRSGARGVDLLLAEKVVGAGTNTRRAVTIQWDEVDAINSWRFGLASATGLQIPDRLLQGTGLHVHAWLARAPMVPLEQRLAAANVAAALGVFSNASLVEIHSLVADQTDPSEIGDSIGGRLGRAYAAPNANARMDALRWIWEQASRPIDRYARLILTARAAARVAPSAEIEGEVDELVAAMLSAGLDEPAARWSGVVEAGEGEGAERAWSMLAVGTARPAVDLSAGRIETFQGRDDSEGDHRTRLLVAALAGLGRLEASDQAQLAGDLGIRLGMRNAWTDAIDGAAQNGQAATVALLVGIGMQTSDWRGVPAEHMFHIIRGLRQVGHEYEARMIAAEAMARL